jgi:beta-lactamase regulating signal transducer with metallopeptidase domain
MQEAMAGTMAGTEGLFAMVAAWLALTAVRVTVWLAAVFVGAWLLRRSAARVRRWLYGLGLAGALLLAVAPVLPALEWEVLPPNQQKPTAAEIRKIIEDRHRPTPRDEGRLIHEKLALAPELPRSAYPPSTAQMPAVQPPITFWGWVRDVLMAVYLMGVLVAVARLIRASRRVLALARAAKPASHVWPAPQGIVVRESAAIDLPITMGALVPIVVVPSSGHDWAPAWRQAVLAHEVAHVRARDPLFQLIAEVARTVYWFHPFVHLAARCLRIERELAADDAALATGMRSSDYAGVLVELACVPKIPPVGAGVVVPLLTPSGLKARLAGALDPARARTVRAFVLALVAVASVAALAPLSLARPVAEPDPRGPRVRSGMVMGRVIDDKDGKPVEDAEVVFRFGGGSLARTSAVTTNDEGWFAYPKDEIPQDAFTVYARKNGRAGRKPVHPVPHGTSLPMTISLRPAHLLSGTIRTPEGKPIPKATIKFFDDDQSAPPPGRQVVAVTDAKGQWRVDGVMYGEFRLLMEAPWGVAISRHVVVKDNDVTGLEDVLDRSWPVTAWLKDAAGRPVAGARVDGGNSTSFVYGPDGVIVQPRIGQRHLDWDESGADGGVRMIPRGTRLTARGVAADGSVVFASFKDGGSRKFFRGGPERRNEKVVEPARSTPEVVTMEKAASISGLVIDEQGKPVPHTHVYAWVPWRGSEHSAWTETDAEGRFEVPNITPGDVFLTAPPDPRRQPRMSKDAELHLLPGEHRKNVRVLSF